MAKIFAMGGNALPPNLEMNPPAHLTMQDNYASQRRQRYTPRGLRPLAPPEDRTPLTRQQGREIFWLVLVTFSASSLRQEEAFQK